MTSSPPARPSHGGDWTIEDLFELPDDNNRYEIRDGRLLVSPPPAVPHNTAASLLTEHLIRAAPEHLMASTAPFGINLDRRRTYYIPDIIVVDRGVRKTRHLAVEPSDVLLVVEVLSPGNRGHDLVAKRHDYGTAGIPQYWILDQDKETLTVLRLDETGKQYVEAAVVRPGEPWHTDEPFPVTFDLGEIL
jgi:Uma2 family endonuclease